MNFNELLSLSLNRTNSLQEPLIQFTELIKKDAARKIYKWYLKHKTKEIIDR
jgi:hypothetical protein